MLILSRKNMMKLSVLHISPAPPNVGGMEAFMGDLLQSSLKNSVRVLLLNLSKPGLQKGGKYAIHTGYTSLAERGFRVSLISYGYSIIFMFRFLRLLIIESIQILHIHTASYTSFWEKCAYILVGRLAGKKIVLHVHGALYDQFYQSSSQLLQRIIRFFLNRCHAIIVLSPAWYQFFKRILPRSPITIIENGIHLAPFQHERRQHDLTNLFHIGEVSRRKGIDDVLKVLSELRVEGFDFFFHIAGPGELDLAEQKIKALNLSPCVKLYGPVRGEQKLSLFKTADVFILASYAEGLPIGLIEAMAAGLPVISTTVGGIPDIVSQGVNGFLFDPGDLMQLKRHIKTCLQSADLCLEIGQVNQKYAIERFDINRCADQMLGIYAALCPKMTTKMEFLR
ncbi:MAG: glycosyltransferase family 1 protein [Calditrichaeota bacterium]|nr:MAG: glycosyltransferase family 1 protein [Calditrichota bacterium]